MDELTVDIVPCVDVIDAAREELSVFTADDSVVTLLARDDEVLVRVLLVEVILAANDELERFIVLDKESTRNAAEELFVVTVPLNETMDELREDDAE